MFAKCANCHRPGEVAPMSLLSYQDARPWAKAIKAKVMSREMPPWGANPQLSLPMRNDVSLSDKEIQTHGGVGRCRRAARQRRRPAAGADLRRGLDLRPRARLHPRDAGRVRHPRRGRARRADVLLEDPVHRRQVRRSARDAAEQSRRGAPLGRVRRRHPRGRADRRRPPRRPRRQALHGAHRIRPAAHRDRHAARRLEAALVGARPRPRRAPRRMSASAFRPAST